MRLRLLVPMAFLCTAASLGGCAVLPTTADAVARRGEFFPLYPGTLWVYEVRDAEGRIALERVLVRGAYHLKAHETDGTVVEESGGMMESK